MLAIKRDPLKMSTSIHRHLLKLIIALFNIVVEELLQIEAFFYVVIMSKIITTINNFNLLLSNTDYLKFFLIENYFNKLDHSDNFKRMNLTKLVILTDQPNSKLSCIN